MYTQASCDMGTVPAPLDATTMDIMTHSIYTIFLPTTLHTWEYSPGHQAARRTSSVIPGAKGAVSCKLKREHSRRAAAPTRRPQPAALHLAPHSSSLDLLKKNA
jgi:hypothetical protein